MMKDGVYLVLQRLFYTQQEKGDCHIYAPGDGEKAD